VARLSVRGRPRERAARQSRPIYRPAAPRRRVSDPSGISANQTTVFDSETIRGRFGYAADNVLFYATGGFAWSNAQFVRTQLTGALNSATAGTDEAVNKGLMGWVAGGGIGYAFVRNWNVFAEYRHTSFGSSSFSLPFSQLTTATTTTVTTVELGMNYKFNSGGQFSGVPPALYSAGAPSPALVYKSPPARYAYNWSGIYLGSDGGFGWEIAKGTLTDATGAPLTSYNYRASGPLAGLFAGGNYQLNRILLGAEGDWQWSNLVGNNQTLAPLGAAGAFPAGPFTTSTTVKDYASVRGRLGFAFDRFLAFGTAGWAWGNPSIAYALVGAAPFVNQGGRAMGWTAGVGVDYAITESVFARIEYRYTNLATAGFVSAATNSADPAIRVPVNDLRASIAYKFGIPVAANF
jgi:outer membrane immunogenic protein